MRKAIIYGTGSCGRYILPMVLQDGYEVLAYCDSDETKIGCNVGEYKIISKSEAIQLCDKDDEIKIIVGVDTFETGIEISKIIAEEFSKHTQIEYVYHWMYREMWQLEKLNEAVVKIYKQIEELPNNICKYKKYSEIGGDRPKRHKTTMSIDEMNDKLMSIVPTAYKKYLQLFENAKNVYSEDPSHNLIVEDSLYEKEYGELLKMYLGEKGYILDIGCGPQEFPGYLKGIDVNRIVGIDPLEPFTSHPFEFVQAVAEYVPYENESFDYVLFVTSLDHVLLLDKTLEEAYRVLRQGGRCLILGGYGSREEPYNPYDENVKAVDDYHMFHIHPNWFEPMMEEKWEKEAFFTDRYGTCFYVYQKI